MASSLIADGVSAGEFREVDPAFALDMAIGCVRGALERRHRGTVIDPVAVADFIILGLGGTPAPARDQAERL